MKFDDYQKQAIVTDAFGGKGDVNSVAFINKVLGLVGETGEVAEKLKKIQRNNNGSMSKEERKELLKELGDILWYLSAIAYYLGEPLGKIAGSSLDKVLDRQSRGVIKSSGDNR